jgi:hypothetical protein
MCCTVLLSACSSNSKKEPAQKQTSLSGQTAQNSQVSDGSQTGAEESASDRASQKNTGSDTPGTQRSKTAVTVNTKQSQPDKKEETKSETKSETNTGNETETKLENETDTKVILPAKVYVFTNSAGCCEAKRQMYEQHRSEVKSVESKYGNRVTFIWLDVSIGDVDYQKQLLQYASSFGINNIPSIVVVDASNNVLIKQEGDLNMTEIDRVFGGLN